MKIRCEQQALAKAVSTVSHAVSSRSTLPILANLLLQAEDGRLKIAATNLEMAIEVWVDATILEDGTTTTPAKTFADLIQSLRAGELELFLVSEETHILQITTHGGCATLYGRSATDYPAISGGEEQTHLLSLSCEALKKSIVQVGIAAADNDPRPILNGVYVTSFQDGSLTFAAADAFRLAMKTLSCAYDGPPLLIPAKTLKEVARLLPADGDVRLFVSRNQILFQTANVLVASSLLNGTFPNVQAAIPHEHHTRITVETKEFASAMKTVLPFARDASNIVRFHAHVQESTLTLEATAEDIGSNVTTMPAHIEGQEQSILFNAKYVMDVLAVIETRELVLELVNAQRPGVIKPVDSSVEYLYVIMPMSTNR